MQPAQQITETKRKSPHCGEYISTDITRKTVLWDHPRIRGDYRVDLDRVTMHWFRFLALLGDLEECAFTQIVGVRSADLSKLDKETKKTYLKLRRKYALPQKESEESQKFMEQLSISPSDDRNSSR